MLDELSDEQLITEVRYMRVTIAPNIREKVKVDKKFRKLNRTELKNEILKVIRPEVNIDSLESLLGVIFSSDSPESGIVSGGSDASVAKDDTIHPGLAALWCGPLDQQSVGVVIPRGSDDVLQLYTKGRLGCYADGTAVGLQDWSVIKVFDNVSFVTKARIVYLQF